ncbi:uncharacterized protein LOC127835682 [Dreissena polymorpha]|uniref:uncharacterized protein LOC127835682 n=1 Tax=Dreissena polymorpha TaxID=45954 RepID=UPI0022644CAE|nr:uncharacterized protein LOC127835682 [Dreissena polymorpha]
MDLGQAQTELSDKQLELNQDYVANVMKKAGFEPEVDIQFDVAYTCRPHGGCEKVYTKLGAREGHYIFLELVLFRDDPFGSDLLPLEGPAPLETLPSEDAETILDVEDEDEEGRSTSRMAVNLTPEMVNAQFVLIDPSTPTDEKVPADAFPHGNRMPATNIPVSAHGPVARENREAELEYFMTKKYNKLGAKIESRNQTLNHFLTNKNLQLK